MLEDPEYLKAERARLRSRPLRFDYVGLGLIVVSMVCMEVLLSKGQEWDWFGGPVRARPALAFGLGFGLAVLIAWELRHPAHGARLPVGP